MLSPLELSETGITLLLLDRAFASHRGERESRLATELRDEERKEEKSFNSWHGVVGPLEREWETDGN